MEVPYRNHNFVGVKPIAAFMPSLIDALTVSPRDIHVIADALDRIVNAAAQIINRDFASRRLAKATRELEPLPTDTRQLSSYRTRIGTMLEYALSTEIDRTVREQLGDDYYFTFAVAHEYPDFYFRDSSLKRLLRIEMKAVDAESDEQAARFGVATVHIRPEEDLLLFVGWQWASVIQNEKEIGEYPEIFATLVVSAIDIVEERDVRLAIAGGKIEGEQVFVPSKDSPSGFGPDGGNYGKLWRLVHGSRRESEELSAGVNKFLDFLRAVDDRAPRKRFK